MSIKSLLRPLFVLLLGLVAFGCVADPEEEGTIIQKVAPPPPTSLGVTLANPTQMDLVWTASPGADAYIVRIGNTPGAMANYTTHPTTSFNAKHLQPNTQYCWEVTAYNTALEISAPSNNVCLTTPPSGTGVSPPAAVTATAISDTRIEVTWTPVTNAFKYYVQRATAAAGPYTFVGSVLDPGNTHLSVNLTPATTYYFQIITVMSDNTESTPSTPPAFATTFGGVAPPTGVTATAISDTRITVAWNSVPVATKYYVYTATSAAGPFSFAGTTLAPTTSFLSVNLTPATTYWYYVVSVDSLNAESGPSSIVSATTFSAGTGGLELYYKFDERSGGVANDSSGFFRHGTLSGASFNTTDRAQIDDNQSVISLSSSTSSKVTTPAAASFGLVSTFTVSFWAKASGSVRFFGMHPAGCGATGWEIGQGGSGLYFQGENGTINAGTSLPSEWAHVAVTYDGATLSFYVNGVAAGSGAYAAQNSMGAAAIELGHPGDCAGGAFLLDELRIQSSALSAAQIAVLGSLPPPPANFRVTSKTSLSVNLAWDAVPGASSYIISKIQGAGTPVFFTHTPNTTTFESDHLLPNTQYTWNVRAVVNGLYSNVSNNITDTTSAVPAAPTGVTATVVQPDRIEVTWTAVPGAFKYYVFQSTNGGAYTHVGSILSPTTTFLAVNLAAGTTYSYQVQAEDAVQSTGPMSAAASATTP